MTLYGIDISSHQGHTPSLVGKAFVFVRATYGAHGDSMYQVHASNVRKAGKVLGAYHFSRPVSTGDTVAEQVHDFLLVAKDAELLAFDWEEDVFIDGNGVRRSNGTMAAADAKAFIAAVQKTGRRIGLYTSASHFRDLGQDFDWVAKWGGTPPARHYDIWQYDGGGTDHIDNDLYRGTLAQLRALGTGPLPESSTEDPVGPKVLAPEPFVGTAKVTAQNVSAINLDDGVLVDLAVGIVKRVVAKGKLATPWPGHPSGVVYLVGDEWSILLAEDVTVTADPTLDCTAAVDAAVAQYEAGEDARTQAAIAADRAKARVGIVYP